MDQNTEDKILVQSSTVDLGGAFPDYVRTNIRRVAGKYFGRLSSASVHVTRDGATYRCTTNMHMGALKPVSGEAKNKDLYAAFRAALQKVAKQLRRSKRELREDKAERTDKDMLLREGAAPRREERARQPMNDEDDYRAAAE
ncbi:ribosome hibernation-promoting factor, HPF/YfiA family [Microvirga roseola]|uniref:ribosome hibernation-promoting factor, HPF/YfiA family n=1 Tax=Microvirga roseola TaxID=2883126 RepID=UPI001E2E1227|nr:ribosome-associated translation inhibitor RaiA [Microvirga roseola]